MKSIPLPKSTTLTILITSLIASPVWADHNRDRQEHIDKAKVVNAEPVYEQRLVRQPYEDCRVETVSYYEDDYQSRRNYTPTVVGTLIGGAIGNAVGHNKSNKKVGAVAGALLGAAVANDLSYKHRGSSQHSPSSREETVCETRYHEEYRSDLIGYDVAYRYLGQVYHTRTRQDPGKFIRVSVNVSPLDF